MTQPVKIIGSVAGACVIAGLLYGGVKRVYVSPRAELASKVEEASRRLAGYEQAMGDVARVQEELQRFADRTLGGDQETVDHRLRTRLNRIAEEVKLKEASVGTGGISVKRSPARSVFRRSGSWRELRDEVDFVELDAWVSGEGAYAQVVELVDRIDAEPWLKRVNHVKLDAKDNGTRFAATVRLTTLYLPNRRPGEAPPAVYDASRLDHLKGLTGGNRFRLAKPAEARGVEVAQPRALPGEQWVLTGIAEGRGGPEVWVRNRNSGEERRLGVGESVAGAFLVSAGGEWASFQVGEKRFQVRLGQNLNDKTAIRE